MAQIETVEVTDREAVLARVLAPPRGPTLAPPAHVRSFARYIDACELEWVAWRCRRQGRETACVFALLLPGGTAITMFTAPSARNIEPEDQRQLVAAALQDLAQRQLHYVQALVEPQAVGKQELLQASGFRHLTQLIYLQRAAALPNCECVPAVEAGWIAYSSASHSAFARMLLATYEDSRDCPELSGLRPIDAVIASHKAAGEFHPALWEIACVAGEQVGCVLLSRLTRGPLMEVVYLGVVPEWRRRGIGKLLLQRALEQCRAVGARELTAVVDHRNDPARQLYARFDFKPTAAREAYIRTW
jgi:mycothiol synthase